MRLNWIISEECRKGNLVRWEPGMELPLHASPAFIAARKGHLTGRMVVDFRQYNTQIMMPCFSMPNSENILNDLKMNILDLKRDSLNITNDIACIKTYMSQLVNEEKQTKSETPKTMSKTMSEISVEKGWFW